MLSYKVETINRSDGHTIDNVTWERPVDSNPKNPWKAVIHNPFHEHGPESITLFIDTLSKDTLKQISDMGLNVNSRKENAAFEQTWRGTTIVSIHRQHSDKMGLGMKKLIASELGQSLLPKHFLEEYETPVLDGVFKGSAPNFRKAAVAVRS